MKAQTDPETAYEEAAISYTEATNAQIAPAIVPIAPVKAHTQAVTAYIAATTNHMHPFKPTATENKNMKKPFSLFET